MAERDAKVRLNLSAAGFTTAMREIERQAKTLADEIEDIGEAGDKADKKLSPFLASMKKGLGAAKSSLTDLGSSIKSTLGQVVTLGGALSLGGLVHGAVELSDRYGDIAFNVNKIPGNLETAATVQRDIETAAANTKVRIADMADAYERVFKATGDLAFTKASLEAIGTVATATGEKVEDIANAAQLLQRKFKVTAEELPEALARFIEKTGVGGKGLDELSNRFALMAGEASEAGLRGVEGVSALLGIMNQLDSAVGEKADPALKMLFQTLKSGTSQLKTLAKEGGIKFDVDDSAFDKLQKIIASPRARRAAEQILTGDARVVFDELARPFDQAVQQAKEAGKTGKELREAGIAAFERNLAEASRSAMTFAQIQRAAEEAGSGPNEQLNDALNKMQQAFTRPEMIAAIEKLAQLMPRIADGMASLLEFAVENPVLAGAGVLGVKAGGAMAGSIAGDLASGLAGAMRDRAVQVGKPVAEAIATAAAAHPKWATAGKAIGVAAAALIGFEIGKSIVDSRIDEKTKIQGDLTTAGAEAHAAALTGDRERMERARDTLKERIEAAKKDRGGVIDTLIGGAATFVDPNFVAPEQKMIISAEADLRRLNEALRKSSEGGGKAGDAMDKTARAAERLANALNRVNPSGGGVGTNGLPPAPGNRSGSLP